MTNEDRLEKNNRIRVHGRLTREKRKRQLCRVYRVKIDISHLSEAQKLHIKMLFVEAKWLYNFALSFMTEHDINDFDNKISTVQCLDKDRSPVTHELQNLGSQLKQAVIQGIKHSLKALAALKTRNHTVGGLRYKSEYVAINLQQFGATYRFYDEHHIGIQGFNERIRIKGGEQKNYKPEIGTDMGIKTSVTTSDGRKYHVLIEESERIKKCHRLIARRKNASSNLYKVVKKLRRASQKLTSRKRDASNKIVHDLLEHEHVYMQGEYLKGWQKGLFGQTVQHSVLGLVKAKLIHNERVIVLPSSVPTTKYCPVCGKFKKDITLAERVYSCSCGYSEDRDIHAARNMILLNKENTCGTQEINAFGENVRQHGSQDLCCSLIELGSSSYDNLE